MSRVCEARIFTIVLVTSCLGQAVINTEIIGKSGENI
jgi:hypothetical protein